MAKSNAEAKGIQGEKKRRFREKGRLPKERERERWKRDTDAGKKKAISDLSERGQRRKRKEWRKAKDRQKRRAEIENSGPTSLTPPQSPDSEIQDAVQARPGSSR